MKEKLEGSIRESLEGQRELGDQRVRVSAREHATRATKTGSRKGGCGERERERERLNSD
jgi:hypothetical protein